LTTKDFDRGEAGRSEGGAGGGAKGPPLDDSDSDVVLVFEDDETLPAGFIESVQEVIQMAPTTIDFVNLNSLRPTGALVGHVQGLGGEAKPLLRLNPHTSAGQAIECTDVYPGWACHEDKDLDYNVWMSAYAITRTGIRKLLKGLQQYPVTDDEVHGIFDHAVGNVVEHVYTLQGEAVPLRAYALPNNAISMHNEGVSFREGGNAGTEEGHVQHKGT
jgi:hypothetical protein